MKAQKTTTQKGFVSIIVAATVMILLSLITIGFTRIMQREQREALDRQLTRQATYAAESGINAIWEYIQDDSVEEEKEDCAYTDGNVYRLDNGTDIELDPPTGPDYSPSQYFDTDDATAAIQVTCVLYDKNPTELRNEVAENEDTIFPFEEKENQDFSSITLEWSGEAAVNYDNSCSSGDSYEFPTSYDAIFPEQGQGVPIIKIDLYNTDSYGRDDLANRASYLYLIPCDSGTTTIALSNQREIIKSNVLCSPEGVCSVSIDVGSMNTSSLFVRHKLLYGSGEVRMGGTRAIDGRIAELKRAQSVIDVTARATDVVRRLRVHVPYNQAENIPSSVISVGAGYTGGPGPNNGLCKLVNIVDSGPTQRIRDDCR